VYKRGSFRSGLQSEGSKYSVWFGSGEWGGSIGWGWWSKFSVLSRKKKIIPLLGYIIYLYDFKIRFWNCSASVVFLAFILHFVFVFQNQV
jgi:hypothetical protein